VAMVKVGSQRQDSFWARVAPQPESTPPHPVLTVENAREKRQGRKSYLSHNWPQHLPDGEVSILSRSDFRWRNNLESRVPLDVSPRNCLRAKAEVYRGETNREGIRLDYVTLFLLYLAAPFLAFLIRRPTLFRSLPAFFFGRHARNRRFMNPDRPQPGYSCGIL
jgi:hypothetical protein